MKYLAFFSFFLLSINTLQAQIHMSAGTTTFTDLSGTIWTPNLCTGTTPYNNVGTYSSLIYNNPVSGTHINCNFTTNPGLYSLLIHTIEVVKTFNAPQKRVFNVLVNGNAVITGLDLFQRSGGVEIPYDVNSVVLTQNGQIQVTMNGTKSSAILAGIELIPVELVTIIPPPPPQTIGLNVLNQLGTSVGTANSVQIGSGLTYQLQNGILQIVADTSVLESRLTSVWGIDRTCVINSGNNQNYVGSSMGNAITTYAENMMLIARVDVPTDGGSITLDCGAGPVPVYQSDSITPPTTFQWYTDAQPIITYFTSNGIGAWRVH